ncbi:MAG TPA: hypothetical protein VNL92_00835, partial [Dehalococcoidia bacterium]|nr:hypothetical protein [Dehalococcoidia bacterium]
GVPDPTAPLPWGIPRLMATLKEETGAELEFHGHNDFGLATANAMMAWRYGCTKINCAFGGLGERTGNTAVEQMVAAMIRLYGDPGFNLGALREIAEFIEHEVSQLSERAPIVGPVFSTQAGLHQTGVARQEDAPGGFIYLPYDPELVGAHQEELSLVGAVSGMDGIAAVLNYGLRQRGKDAHFTNANRVVKLIYDRVQAAYDGEYDAASGQYKNVRRTFFTPEELVAMAEELGAV